MKLLILDVDGVMTDGTKVYDNTGEAVFKRFCDHDFTAIQRFKEIGVHTCFLTADRAVNEQVALNRHIDFFYSRRPDGGIDKPAFIPILSNRYNVPVCNMMYIGDDYFDLSIIEAIKSGGGLTFCPINAITDVQDEVDYVIDKCGGYGVVASLYTKYVSEPPWK